MKAYVLPRLGLLAALALALFAVHPAAANEAEARQVIQQLESEGLSLASPGMPLAQKEDRFRRALHEHFDLPTIARFVLGRHWNTADAAERRRFVGLFEDVTTKTWAKRFSDYKGDGLDILGVQRSSSGYSVQTAVRRAAAEPVPVTWRLAETNRGLKVVDIVVEGVSMAITHRSEYASLLRSAGLPGLLGAMQDQVAQAR
jgi:phospholipid transport system substrate-binding protein